MKYPRFLHYTRSRLWVSVAVLAAGALLLSACLMAATPSEGFTVKLGSGASQAQRDITAAEVARGEPPSTLAWTDLVGWVLAGLGGTGVLAYGGKKAIDSWWKRTAYSAEDRAEIHNIAATKPA